MLSITIPDTELWDEEKEEFIYVRRQTLQLEHSLISVSKWESKWNKPFFTDKKLTREEAADYVRCMTLTKNVDDNIYLCLTPELSNQISEYMNRSMTAAWFREKKGEKRSSKQVTSDLIYYWMVALNIPFECEKWHLNRLLTLIRVCDIENQPKKKMSDKESMAQHRAILASRRRAAGRRR